MSKKRMLLIKLKKYPLYSTKLKQNPGSGLFFICPYLLAQFKL